MDQGNKLDVKKNIFQSYFDSDVNLIYIHIIEHSFLANGPNRGSNTTRKTRKNKIRNNHRYYGKP